MKKLAAVRQMSATNPMGGPLKDHPDSAGGYMDSMMAPKVAVPAPGNVKASQVDGPYGGKVKA